MESIGPDLPPDLLLARKNRSKPISSADVDSSQATTENKHDETAESESEDYVGPMLATEDSKLSRYTQQRPQVSTAAKPDTHGRQDWMMTPPSSTDWVKNFDPTKLKSRGFSTSKPGSSAPVGNEQPGSKWTSVPGVDAGAESVTPVPAQARAVNPPQPSQEPSLYEQHNQKRRRTGTDSDDVSQRPFDRHKDIVGRVDNLRTRQLAESSKDLNSKFHATR